MILLLGGTSDAVHFAEKLVESGKEVLLSMATDTPVSLQKNEMLRIRRGPLEKNDIVGLLRENKITLILDATHPFAVRISKNARDAAQESSCRYVRYSRPTLVEEDDSVVWVDSHQDAAARAVEFGKPILLTTGSTVLTPYVRMAADKNIPLYARVLDREASVTACRDAGLPESSVIRANGPFTVEDTAKLIRRFSIRVLVSKDSGDAGGVREKLAAARRENCSVVLIRRPAENTRFPVFESRERLLSFVLGE
jgi:precorrin-6A/cobalt-precorrin-6A reductase